ncbi:hypothetical protein GCM10023069_33720 [Shinella granuli]
MQQHMGTAIEELPGGFQADAAPRARHDDVRPLEQGWMKHVLSSDAGRDLLPAQYHKKWGALQEGGADQLMCFRFCIL